MKFLGSRYRFPKPVKISGNAIFINPDTTEKDLIESNIKEILGDLDLTRTKITCLSDNFPIKVRGRILLPYTVEV